MDTPELPTLENQPAPEPVVQPAVAESQPAVQLKVKFTEETVTQKEESNKLKNYVDGTVILAWSKWFLAQKSLNTCLTYESFIKKFVGSGIRINQKNLDSFMQENNICGCLSALKSFLKFLVYKQGYPESLFYLRFEKTKNRKRLPRSISQQEILNIINSMRSLRTRLITLFIYELGLRLSECFKIKYEDFNWTEWLGNRENFGKVDLKNTKRDKFAVMPVKSEIMNLIYNSHDRRNERGIPIGTFVFYMNPDENWIKNYMTNQELSNEMIMHTYIDYNKHAYRMELYRVSQEVIGKKISPHVLRHSRAQHLMDKGMPIESLKEFLRHSAISTTEIYAQASPEKVKKDLITYDTFKTEKVELQTKPEFKVTRTEDG